jgi:hypothetical protein
MLLFKRRAHDVGRFVNIDLVADSTAIQLMIGAAGGEAGGFLGLTATTINMRHERRLAGQRAAHDRILADESRARDWEHQAVIDVLASINHFSRAIGELAWTYDDRYVRFADANDRADLVVRDPAVRRCLGVTNRKMKVVHAYRANMDPSIVGPEWWKLLDDVWLQNEPLAEAMRARLAPGRGPMEQF